MASSRSLERQKSKGAGTLKKSESCAARKTPELTERDVKLGRATWAKNIGPQKAAFGELIFKELFRTYPEYEFFFQHMGQSGSVYSNTRFQSHMKERVVSKMGEILDTLDKPEKLGILMGKLGIYHAKLKVKRRHMEDMLKVLFVTLKNFTEHKLQPDEEMAIYNCFASALSIANEAIDLYEAKMK